MFSEWVDLPSVPTVTPLHPDQFAQELCFHPDQAQVSYVVEGLRDGKWHLIVDMSSPGGRSVNDGIDPESLACSTC